MFLHIGNSKNIRQKNIIGIFDADTATVSGITRRFLAIAEKKGQVRATNEEVPKSFVMYQQEEGTVIYFSQLSTTALSGRNDEITAIMKKN